MSDAGGPPLLEATIIRKSFASPQGEVLVVDGLELAVASGEIVCLIGPSGCGKTTSLRILIGLDRDFDGRVLPDPRDLRLGVVFQEPRLLPWRTVEQNIRLALPAAERARDIAPLLAELGIDTWRSRFPSEISLGMARRVSLARALAVEPALLVLDEPFVSLDDRAADALRANLAAALAKRNIAALMVTHNLREALSLADRLVLLTPRPARVAHEIRLDTPREKRGGSWIEAERRALAQHFAMGD